MGTHTTYLRLPEHTVIRKLGGWLYRYLPAEILGTIGALTAAGLAAYVSDQMIVVAIAGAWGETIGFYLPMVVREFTGLRRDRALLPAVWRTMRNLLLEFGVAELLDTGLLRPGLMALAMQLIAPMSLAIVIGKLAADLFFYGFAICGYELRQRLDTQPQTSHDTAVGRETGVATSNKNSGFPAERRIE